jgi:predicted nucleic acid-binding Zn finger protein
MKIIKQKDKFKVESSKKGKFYIVDLAEPSCSCPHFQFRMKRFGGECKHIKEVRDFAEKRTKRDYDNIIATVRKQDSIETVKLIEQFGEQPVDDLLARGELIEQNGFVRVLE